MNAPNERLSRALCELAADSPQGAPPELGARLNAAFARHHRVRRQKRAALVVAVAGAFALSVVILRTNKPERQQVQAPQPQPVTVEPAATAPKREHPRSEATIAHVAPGRGRHSNAGVHRRVESPNLPGMANGDFIALSSFDPAIPMGQGRIVRVELSGSALRSAGYPVNAELMQQRVVTDVLLGQDGRPYAARLVQTRMVH